VVGIDRDPDISRLADQLADSRDDLRRSFPWLEE